MKKSLTALFLISILITSFTFPTRTQANINVTLLTAPNVSNVQVGQRFLVTVKLQTGSQTVDGVQVNLDFDVSKLKVTQVTGNTVGFPLSLQNQYDNILGTIDYAAGTVNNFPSGTVNVVQIQLEAIDVTPETYLSFHQEAPRKSDVTSVGNSVLTDVSGGKVIIIENTSPQTISSVSVSSKISGWPETRLMDGDLNTVWSSVGHNDHLVSSDWAAVILPATTTIDRLRIHPRANPNSPADTLGFPKDFVIQYSYNGSGRTCDPASASFRLSNNWVPLISRFGYTQPPSGPIDFTFPAKQAGCVRIFAVEESQDDYGKRYLQLAEIELYQNDTKKNISSVSVSSKISGWPETRLMDGDLNTVWSSVGHNDHLVSSDWAAVILPATTTIDRLRIHPRANPNSPADTLGFPKDFVIQYSYNGSGRTCDPASASFRLSNNWVPLISRFGYTQPPSGPIDFTFPAKQAGCVRIFAVEESQDDYGKRYLQLAEIELFFNPNSPLQIEEDFLLQPSPTISPEEEVLP